jgi:hypothetical protein
MLNKAQLLNLVLNFVQSTYELLIPPEARFFVPVKNGPGAHQTSCTIDTETFSGVNRPGLGVDNPPPTSSEIKERVELYLYYVSGPSQHVIGEFYVYKLILKF